VPYPGDGLLGGCVPQVEALDEGYHVRRACMILSVDVASLRGVSE
jgi:hypothetical protein